MSVPFPSAHRPEQPGDGPAGRPKLADSVSIAVELWVVVIVGQIIAFVGQYQMIRDFVADYVADLPEDTPQSQIDLLSEPSTTVGLMVVVGTVLTVISIGVVLLVRNGYNAARVLLGGMSAYLAVSMVMAFFADMTPGWVMIPVVISGVAALGAAVMLMRGDSYTYCRAMARHRRDKRNPPRPQMPASGGYPPYPQGGYPQSGYPQAGYPQAGEPPAGQRSEDRPTPEPGSSYGEQQPTQTEGRNSGDQT
ncbi:hypothetical protein GII33_18740 [Gordonia pseudamarae]|jgi:hypothetical protein|uniref:Uncharacterized protein n=1 Tax=Gordonia pseudamarae TaxID=2831662 RepID=A0ABX6IMM8_9ACTN|nr:MULTISPECIES: hypothetical protein [Gordonia]MBD0020667.1 hypothetical protein [Gordonia sp. (in: high G+C Gram-positive bacteria)]QHN27709.1 hypothetical protein GII33_18740 [Gordonia pseudamarae]QHN36591.1 hypothetical protein GII31_18515 [Gordonia pseudamarae]